MKGIPFTVIDWETIMIQSQKGQSGEVASRTVHLEGLRVRIVEYSAGYVADHWCRKGHIIHCLEGDFTSEMENGEKFLLQKGMSYIVSDDLSSHRSVSQHGVKLLIIDGDFLKTENE